MKRLTLYDTLDYEDALTRWEWYENRQDFLNMITIDFKEKLTVEEFHKGRPDAIKGEFSSFFFFKVLFA